MVQLITTSSMSSLIDVGETISGLSPQHVTREIWISKHLLSKQYFNLSGSAARMSCPTNSSTMIRMFGIPPVFEWISRIVSATRIIHSNDKHSSFKHDTRHIIDPADEPRMIWLW
jgi:hypothetical protein